jgi:hypothetical protein
LLNDAPEAERLVVEAVRAVRLLTYSEPTVAFTAEKLVVEATDAKKLVVVALSITPLVI